MQVEITPSELAFLREAVDEKYANLMKILEFKKPEPVWEPVKAADMPDLFKNIEQIDIPAKKKGRPAKPKAPWGYKKDGTPKKRPGRAPGAF